MKVFNSITIKVIYGGGLKRITEKESEEITVSEGLDFLHFLGFLFPSYPDIERMYPPGTISLLLNDSAPQTMDLLKDGDVIKLKAV